MRKWLSFTVRELTSVRNRVRRSDFSLIVLRALHKSVNVECLFVLKHEVDRHTESVGDDALGPSFAIFRLESLIEFFDAFVLLSLQYDFSKGPFQIGVSDFMVFRWIRFSRRGSLAFDHTTIR